MYKSIRVNTLLATWTKIYILYICPTLNSKLSLKLPLSELKPPSWGGILIGNGINGIIMFYSACLLQRERAIERERERRESSQVQLWILNPSITLIVCVIERESPGWPNQVPRLNVNHHSCHISNSFKWPFKTYKKRFHYFIILTLVLIPAIF